MLDDIEILEIFTFAGLITTPLHMAFNSLFKYQM